LIGGLSRVSRYMTVAVVYDPDSRIFIIGAFNELELGKDAKENRGEIKNYNAQLYNLLFSM